jgi:hypothetical protein
MSIYAFTGKKQSGKSTAVAYLHSLRGMTKVNFKDALVGEIVQNFPDLIPHIIEYTERRNYDGGNPLTVARLIAEKPPLFRTLMQNYGTEVRRRDDPDYWVNQWKESVRQVKGDITTDDVRFANEAKAVREMGGVVIRIVRPDQTNTDTHVSETEMDAIHPDYTIEAITGDFENLYEKLQRLQSIIKTA